MNALVSILEPTAPLSPGLLFGTGQIDAIVSQIETEVRAELYDATTEEGRERVKSVAYKIARSKTTLDEIGKEHVAHIKAQSAGIDKERKTLRDRLDALKDEIRKPVTDWEEAEAKRIADHEAYLVDLLLPVNPLVPVTAIRERIERVAALSARNWQEFKERADEAIAGALHSANHALVVAEQRERDATELEALRREKAERDRKDAEAAEAARQAAIEDDRKANEAIRAARAEEEKAAAVAAAIAAAEAKAERDKAAAIEAERRRQEQEAATAAASILLAAAAEKKRQENKRHREKIERELAADFMGKPHPGNPITEEVAQILLDLLATNRIRHLSINY